MKPENVAKAALLFRLFAASGPAQGRAHEAHALITHADCGELRLEASARNAILDDGDGWILPPGQRAVQRSCVPRALSSLDGVLRNHSTVARARVPVNTEPWNDGPEMVDRERQLLILVTS